MTKAMVFTCSFPHHSVL